MRIVIASLNPAIERLLMVKHNKPGTVHRLLRSETLAGGKGVNVARVIAQLESPGLRPFTGLDQAKSGGVEALLVGPLGGPTGSLQATLLDAEGLRGQYCHIKGWTRTNEVLLDDSDPEAATVYNAAGPHLSNTEVQSIRLLAHAALKDAALLVCTGSLPPGLPSNFYGEWIEQAHAQGVRSLLDAHGDALRFGAAAHPFIIKVNRDEIEELAQSTGDGSGKIITDWMASGTEAVIITDGTRPTEAHTPDGILTVQSPKIETRSAVGSGDAFTAGLVWSLITRPRTGWANHLTLAAACGASNAASVLARLAVEAPPGQLLDQVVVHKKENQ